MRWLGAVWAVCEKDLRAEGRSREAFTLMFTFGLLVAVMMGFATDADREAVARVFPGLLWIVVLFAGLLGLQRSFAQERAAGATAGLLMAPVDRSAIFYGKFLANLTFMLLVGAVTVPLFFLLFDQPPPAAIPEFVAVVFLGTLGLAAAGTLLAALAASTRAGEVLLPLAFFPVVVPVLIGAVQASRGVLLPDLADPARTSIWFKGLLVYDGIFLILPLLLFEFLLEV